jgi:hypothetical protein
MLAMLQDGAACASDCSAISAAAGVTQGRDEKMIDRNKIQQAKSVEFGKQRMLHSLCPSRCS